jgi:hypothetical protein
MMNPPNDPQGPVPPEGGHYYIPAGMPPGHDPMVHQDGPPEGVYYFRIFGALMALLSAAVIVGGMAIILSPILNPTPGPMSPGASSAIVGGIVYVVFGTIAFVPFMIALFGGRRRWVHTLGTILVAFSMLFFCCVIPVGIPLLIVWQKPETKRWFGAP